MITLRQKLYESILDDEEDLIDKSDDIVFSDAVSPEYVKYKGEHLLFLDVDCPYYPDRVIQFKGIGVIIEDRKHFPKNITQGYKGWSIRTFIYSIEFTSQYSRKRHDTGWFPQTNLIPSYINNDKAKEIADKYMYISKMPLNKVIQKGKAILGKVLQDDKLLKQFIEYCQKTYSEETFIKYDDMIKKLLD